MKKISISEFIKDYAEHDLENQREDCFGFYDWFCADGSLKRKAIAMIPKIKFLSNQGILNEKTTYVWFKNNCPMDGNLYDDMRFSLLDDDNTFLGGIAPSSGHTSEKGVCNLWTIVDSKLDKEVSFKNWSTFKNEVLTNEEFRNELRKHFYRN